MTKLLRRTASFVSLLAVCACVHQPEASAPAEPSKLRHDASEVPQAVRAIEALIDAEGALIADEIEIHCSCNYEWDVSLSGTDVLPLREDHGTNVSEARGKARALFRNLEMRAARRIAFHKSGFDVQPYIRIFARGQAAYATPTGVVRGAEIRIENSQLRVDGLPLGAAPR